MRCASRPEVRSAPPKVLEPVRRHFGVPDRMLDVPVARFLRVSRSWRGSGAACFWVASFRKNLPAAAARHLVNVAGQQGASLPRECTHEPAQNWSAGGEEKFL